MQRIVSIYIILVSFMLGTIGAPTLIDLCCSESAQEIEMVCCSGMEDMGGMDEDDMCCDTDITFESIDGEFHKAEGFAVATLAARSVQTDVVVFDPSLTSVKTCVAPPPGTKLPSTPTNERLGVFLI